MAASEEGIYVSTPALGFSSRVTDITKFTAGFTELWESKAFHDFTLTCGSQSMKVHRAVITANSLFFKRALFSAYDDGDTVKSLHVEADPELLNLLLRFLYSGQLDDVLIEKAEALGELADHLGVPELALQCDRAHLIHTEPDTSNCLSAWSKALSIEDLQLVDKYQELALREFGILRDQPEFVMLPYSSLVKYLTHTELHISDEDERLEAAMTWLRYDVGSRSQCFSELLRALPLRKMARGFLRHLLNDPAVRDDPRSQAIIRAALARPSSHPVPDACKHNTMACTAVMWYNAEHITVYLASFDKPVAVISSPYNGRQLGDAACCSDGTDLYVSGLGTYYDEVYCCDVLKKSWKRMNSLQRGRYRHCMVVSNGKVLVLGGYDPESYRLVSEVEEVVEPGQLVRATGTLRGEGCRNTCCCSLSNDDLVVWGAYDESGCMLVQVFSADMMKTTHVMQLPDVCVVDGHDVSGVARTDEHVILAVGTNVFMCPIRDLYDEVSTCVRKLSHFSPPDVWCVLTLSTDKQQVLLVGGNAEYRVYKASVSQLLADSSTGWSPVRVNWDEQYWAFPGAVCNVCMPISTTDTE